MSTIEDELRADLELSTVALERLRRKMEALAKEAAVYREYYLADVAQTAAEVARDRAECDNDDGASDEIVAANLAASSRYLNAREAVDQHRMAADAAPQRGYALVDPGFWRQRPAGGHEELERQARELVEQQIVNTWAEAAVARTKERDEARAQAANPLPGVRAVVLRFAIEMERTLRANDYKDGWEDEDPDYLLDGIKRERKELKRAVEASVYHNDCVRHEAVDVANFAMMLADQADRWGEDLPADLQADFDAIRNRKGT